VHTPQPCHLSTLFSSPVAPVLIQVHKSRGPGSLSYSNLMPDLDLLMAEWPPELEAALANTKLPAANLVSRGTLQLAVVLSTDCVQPCRGGATG
jgi:hypothetical protein